VGTDGCGDGWLGSLVTAADTVLPVAGAAARDVCCKRNHALTNAIDSSLANRDDSGHPLAVQAPHVVVPLAHKEAGYLSLVQRTMTRCIVRAVDVGLLADTRWIARGRAAPRPWPLLVSVCWLLCMVCNL